MSVGVGRIFESVCLFVRSITQKRMIPQCSNLVQGMILGYPTSATDLKLYCFSEPTRERGRHDVVIRLRGHKSILQLVSAVS